MFNPSGELGLADATVLLLLLTALSFAVSWLTTDVLHLPRTPYIAVLAMATAGATSLTVALADVPLDRLLGEHWARGILAGLAAGAIGAAGLRRLPATLRRSGRRLWEAEAWEGVVYGISEGVLLSALPVVIAWQAGRDAGWSSAVVWAAAIGASAFVIAIHHFGYWDFRNRHVLEALGACLLLSVACLASGSVLAPVLGHIVLHAAGVQRGIELPPRPRPVASPS